jgi:hypothetical protein
MQRTLTLTIISLFLSGTLWAQDQKPDTAAVKKSKMTFDFYAAYSMALGHYKETDRDGDYSGYASGGFMAQIKLNWLGKKDLGLGISYVFQQNSIQHSATDIVPEGGDTLGDKPWNNHYLLAGPVMVKEFSKKIVLDAGVLVGVVIASSNTFTMTVPVDSVHSSFSSGAGTGFAFQARASVGYRVSKRIILTAGVCYLGGNPTRKKQNYVYSVVEDPPGSGQYVPVFTGYEEIRKKKISTFNPGIGLIIKL